MFLLFHFYPVPVLHEQEFIISTSSTKGFNMRNLLKGWKRDLKELPMLLRSSGAAAVVVIQGATVADITTTASQQPQNGCWHGDMEFSCSCPTALLTGWKKQQEDALCLTDVFQIMYGVSNQENYTSRILVAKESGNVVFVFPASIVQDSALKWGRGRDGVSREILFRTPSQRQPPLPMTQGPF